MGKAIGATAVYVDMQLRVNENPNIQTTGFLRKNDMTLLSVGNSSLDKTFDVPIKFSGPCIIKVTATSSVNDIDCKSAFDLVLVRNT